ncbi:hypothetical protein QFC20_006938 [Naganishia adeliensis]|uniref:Uncharacterized protein n=1 Tax=Naganishia adeliensis TaxID=92952 RepID=A0ACC2V535_9TREE|nr:hypothetical protein QFC20_006938 [Naganishia adeliensis]
MNRLTPISTGNVPYDRAVKETAHKHVIAQGGAVLDLLPPEWKGHVRFEEHHMDIIKDFKVIRRSDAMGHAQKCRQTGPLGEAQRNLSSYRKCLSTILAAPRRTYLAAHVISGGPVAGAAYGGGRPAMGTHEEGMGDDTARIRGGAFLNKWRSQLSQNTQINMVRDKNIIFRAFSIR